MRFLISVIVLALLLAAPLRGGDAAAEAYVAALSADFETAAEIAQTDPAAGGVAIKAVLDRRFDIRSVALSALPKDWRDSATPAYVAAYERFLVNSFLDQMLAGSTGTTEILGRRTPSENLVLVGTRVSAPGRVTRTVEWYLTPVLAPGDNGFRVVNFSVDGILLTARQADDFAPYLAAGGLPALIDHLSDPVGN